MIAGAGFAMMAWTEAQRRTYCLGLADPGRCPGAANIVDRSMNCPHCVYQDILDAAWGEWCYVRAGRTVRL